jgi:hypothetical protein
MESINIKILNELLSEKTRKQYFLNEEKGHWGVPDVGNGNQDDYNETLKYYRHPEMPTNVFLQISYRTDSYGDNDKIAELKFVQGVAKQITIYEPI